MTLLNSFKLVDQNGIHVTVIPSGANYRIVGRTHFYKTRYPDAYVDAEGLEEYMKRYALSDSRQMTIFEVI
ncbi:hypothetical protein ETI08_03600 [Macrococcoides goetzii]|nr:hypothetical protein [Macrococcus goetzii]TDM48236.1 hypothetical protein ETI08_03600 [Macrococcus goetzii]